jgi:hypothetical protein
MHPYDPNSSDTDVCDSVYYCRVCDTEIDQSGYCETCDWAPASSTTKVVGDITYGLPYLTCQACQGKCDPTHRYVLQVDRIIDIVHKCNRAVIEICAGCYTKFPWNLDIEP